MGRGHVRRRMADHYKLSLNVCSIRVCRSAEYAVDGDRKSLLASSVDIGQ